MENVADENAWLSFYHNQLKNKHYTFLIKEAFLAGIFHGRETSYKKEEDKSNFELTVHGFKVIETIKRKEYDIFYHNGKVGYITLNKGICATYCVIPRDYEYFYPCDPKVYSSLPRGFNIFREDEWYYYVEQSVKALSTFRKTLK